ncbi:MAG: hypothetical protein SLAVMIC_00670 [uncultured marine phage]|uniref:Uncharacterized protein n=1 Tax=uncultured marine phage TaxID=707152 RepID=A0A8D9FSC0_9VIRU|nr:MAG: hypothetical protein SLAVMIC_00670 [uncultured marine phage]
MIEEFKKVWGKEIYIEKEKQYKGIEVKLKKSDLEGVIESLWLPKIDEKSKIRKNDLYLVNWTNGKKGIVELKDLEYK